MKAIAHQRRRFSATGACLSAQAGRLISHKKLFRLYREERLAVRRRGGRKQLGWKAPSSSPFACHQRRDLALRHAQSSAPTTVAPTAKLGNPAELWRSMDCTKIIENRMSTVRSVTSNLKHCISS
jgi:hypothetical protein